MTLRIHGNRLLKTLPGQSTRPTSARVREAVFNILQGSIAGCRWLDLCAGSGAMGAEALSRGASYVLGIEQSGQACAVVSQNWQRVARHGQTFDVVRGDVAKQLLRLEVEPFDVIYFDPPYASNLYQPALTAIAARSILKSTGALVVEHAANIALPVTLSGSSEGSGGMALSCYRQKAYGRTRLSLYGTYADS
ncbi:MAG: 16S rRNA (guanine(966)-N(2))-methyltransferase RsmD [Elainellaceae cyanobacterium]